MLNASTVKIESPLVIPINLKGLVEGVAKNCTGPYLMT
jgi:hypothetical protein